MLGYSSAYLEVRATNIGSKRSTMKDPKSIKKEQETVSVTDIVPRSLQPSSDLSLGSHRCSRLGTSWTGVHCTNAGCYVRLRYSVRAVSWTAQRLHDFADQYLYCTRLVHRDVRHGNAGVHDHHVGS